MNADAQCRNLSDNQIIERLQDAAEAEDVFSATREWSLEKMRLSIHSRGDYFDRQGLVSFERDGNEALRVELSSMPATIGRGEKADCKLDFGGVSRLHCRLERVGNLVRICDAGSKNGTILNGKKIDFEDLCDGDELQLGSVLLRIRRA
ncbi:Glycogen accumulation regulator GarA [Pontiella desulfatans]|uniref:Glycogen accumulation regulator GarA n=1 Tax=Pontiella desulfatans TaxID=2750659 RepID=A0A6C2TX56_PONDE|nr:FHA domain-containing protein [Pontiella desulfatans]VGO12094.1 Glycogen accumulation regulator GarA [Pontiella desulfatans]